MAALFIGAISGIACAIFALILDASWFSALIVYSVSGTAAVIAHALVIGMVEPALRRRKLRRELIESWMMKNEPSANETSVTAGNKND